MSTGPFVVPFDANEAVLRAIIPAGLPPDSGWHLDWVPQGAGPRRGVGDEFTVPSSLLPATVGESVTVEATLVWTSPAGDRVVVARIPAELKRPQPPKLVRELRGGASRRNPLPVWSGFARQDSCRGRPRP